MKFSGKLPNNGDKNFPSRNKSPSHLPWTAGFHIELDHSLICQGNLAPLILSLAGHLAVVSFFMYCENPHCYAKYNNQLRGEFYLVRGPCSGK